MSRQFGIIVVAAAASAFIGAAAHAQRAETAFTFQGEAGSAGASANGPHDLRFRLLDSAAGDGQLGSTLCADDVNLADGRFSVQLDFGSQFNGQERFLEIQMRADTGLHCGDSSEFVTLSPRLPLTAAPTAVFALNARAATNAAQLNGQGATFYQDAANLSNGTIPDARLSGAYTRPLVLINSDNVVHGTFEGTGSGLTNLDAAGITTGTLSMNRVPNPFVVIGLNPTCIVSGVNASAITGSAGVCGYSTALTGIVSGTTGTSLSVDGRGVYGLAIASTGPTCGVSGEAASSAGRGVYGLASAGSGQTFGVAGVSNSTSGAGVSGLATSISGTTYGGRFVANSFEGTGVMGLANFTGFGIAAYGVVGQSNAATGRGVYGLSTATTDLSYGVYGQSASDIGSGVYGRNVAATGAATGGRFESTSTSGRGVRGYATATSGVAIGGEFQTFSVSGRGIWARDNGGGGTSYGVFGQSGSQSGVGVYGWNAGGQSGVGVHGFASSLVGTIYGVYGEASTLSAGYGVFASGDTGASGTKAFRIDHPDDPENTYLLHYSAESAEVINFYRGTVLLDEAGEAVVELPAYFGKINMNPSYTLTAVGAPMPLLHVAEEIDEAALNAGAAAGPGEPAPLCSFRIAGGAAGAKASWRVEAVRNDLWVRANGAPVRADKQGRERGTYQHPELYGQPAERGMNYDATRAEGAAGSER